MCFDLWHYFAANNVMLTNAGIIVHVIYNKEYSFFTTTAVEIPCLFTNYSLVHTSNLYQSISQRECVVYCVNPNSNIYVGMYSASTQLSMGTQTTFIFSRIFNSFHLLLFLFKGFFVITILTQVKAGDERCDREDGSVVNSAA